MDEENDGAYDALVLWMLVHVIFKRWAEILQSTFFDSYCTAFSWNREYDIHVNLFISVKYSILNTENFILGEIENAIALKQ